MSMKFTAAVHNVYDYAKNCKYIIARYCGGEYWFFGADDDEEKAHRIAEDINGVVLENEAV